MKVQFFRGAEARNITRTSTTTTYSYSHVKLPEPIYLIFCNALRVILSQQRFLPKTMSYLAKYILLLNNAKKQTITLDNA